MAKPALLKCNAVIMAALMGQPLHIAHAPRGHSGACAMCRSFTTMWTRKPHKMIIAFAKARKGQAIMNTRQMKFSPPLSNPWTNMPKPPLSDDELKLLGLLPVSKMPFSQRVLNVVIVDHDSKEFNGQIIHDEVVIHIPAGKELEGGILGWKLRA